MPRKAVDEMTASELKNAVNRVVEGKDKPPPGVMV